MCIKIIQKSSLLLVSAWQFWQQCSPLVLPQLCKMPMMVWIYDSIVDSNITTELLKSVQGKLTSGDR